VHEKALCKQLTVLEHQNRENLKILYKFGANFLVRCYLHGDRGADMPRAAFLLQAFILFYNAEKSRIKYTQTASFMQYAGYPGQIEQ
jgi:hypothetical protein